MYKADELAMACKEAEENIIAEIITDADNIKYIDELNEEDFYYSTNRKIFEFLKELRTKEQTIDLITIKELGVSKKYNGNALIETLVAMTDSLPLSRDIENTVKIIKNLSMKRRVQAVMQKISKNLVEIDIDKDENEIKNEVVQEFLNLKIRQKNTENEMSDIMVETVKDIENKYNKRNDYSYRTGYLDLDKIIERFTRTRVNNNCSKTRSRENGFCFTNGRTYSSKRKIHIFCKFRNERKTAW